jgi:hypothetical protein
MEGIEQRYIIKFLWKEGTDGPEIYRRLRAVYGDSSYAHMLSGVDDNRPHRIEQTIASEKHMLNVQ